MEEWKECKLGEIATITKLAGFEFTKYIKYNETGEIIALRALNLRNGRLDLTEVKHIDKSVSDALPRSKLYKGEILFTYTGNGYGDCALVDEDDKYHLAPNICKISPNKKIADSNFLFQTIRSNAFYKQVSNYIGGSSQPTIPMETIRQLKVKLPPLSTQQKIAAILSSLDDKIELNNKINTNHEQQAQALFKNWFVDFEPFGGKMPEGWKVGKLSDIAEITMGQSPDGKSYNENGEGTVFYQGRAEFGTRFPTRRLFTTEPKRIAKKLDTLMSVRAPVGDLNIANEDCCIGRGLAAIHSKDRHQSFVHYTVVFLRPQLDVFNGEGTVFGCINREALNNMEVIIPSKIDLDKFEKIVTTMDIDIFNRSEENDRLKNIRDTLLPKLMNGEIEV